MIPYAIFRCTVANTQGRTLALRALELSDRFFTVRVCDEDQDILSDAAHLSIAFFLQSSCKYENITCTDFDISRMEQAAFWYTYRITPYSDDYRRHARLLSREYLHYIELKLSGDDALLSEALTGYPAQQEQIFRKDAQEQYHCWLEGLQADVHWLNTVQSAAGLALWLDRPALWEAYLEESFSGFFRRFCVNLKLTGHPFSRLSPDTIYFGNQYCIHLLPAPDTLIRCIQKAESEQLHPVLVLPPIPERAFSRAEELLSTLSERAAGKTELVVNDWGTLFYLRTHTPDSFTLTAGSMLFRSTRDPRLLRSPFLNQVCSAGISDEYAYHLQQDAHISAISAELAFLPEHFSSMKRCLQLPFYQTNTSGYCPLAASCTYGQRGKQEAASQCAQFCRDYAYLYPDFLRMLGIGNTLFGFHSASLEDSDTIRKALRPGIDRLVFLFP